MARLTVRVDLGPGTAIGPGKIRLLELIGESGSISAAGRSMGMSYRRAWTLVAGVNQGFREVAVETQLGGTRGGGAVLTRFGRDLIAHYRAIERAATRAGGDRLATLEAALAARPARTGRRKSDPATTLSEARSPLMPRRARRARRASGRAGRAPKTARRASRS